MKHSFASYPWSDRRGAENVHDDQQKSSLILIVPLFDFFVFFHVEIIYKITNTLSLTSVLMFFNAIVVVSTLLDRRVDTPLNAYPYLTVSYTLLGSITTVLLLAQPT